MVSDFRHPLIALFSISILIKASGKWQNTFDAATKDDEDGGGDDDDDELGIDFEQNSFRIILFVSISSTKNNE